jgi:hypothetical protein
LAGKRLLPLLLSFHFEAREFLQDYPSVAFPVPRVNALLRHVVKGRGNSCHWWSAQHEDALTRIPWRVTGAVRRMVLRPLLAGPLAWPGTGWDLVSFVQEEKL